MKVLANVVLFIAKCLVWAFWNSRMAQVWYRLYQWVWQRDERKAVTIYKDFRSLVAVISKLEWRADGVRELGDAVSHPEHIQFLIDSGEKFIGDCDEFGVYEAAAISLAMSQDAFLDTALVSSCMMSVMWQENDKVFGFGGHNVCGLKWVHPDGSEEFGYMDYGMPIRGKKSWDEVAGAVIKRYTKFSGRQVGVAQSEPYSLKLVAYKW